LLGTTVKDGGFGKFVHHRSCIQSTRRSCAPTATLCIRFRSLTSMPDR
jgi:hypothetical protein